MGTVSTLSDNAIAGKIASTLNRHTCHSCSRPVEGGVFAFGLSGSDARWYPTKDEARRSTPGVRYIHEHGQDVTKEQILDWLADQRDELEALMRAVEEDRYHRQQAREAKRLEAHADRGCKTGGHPCDCCGRRKHRPADACEHCGDLPVPLGITDQDYNRARGYAY